MSNVPDIKGALQALSEASGEGMSNWQKVAVLLVSLGQDAAAEVLRQFDEEEVGEITQAIAELKNIPRQDQDEALLEFQELLEHGDGTVRGGENVARGMLVQALGEDAADRMWQKMGGRGKRRGFTMLERADPGQVTPFVRKQHPQTIALILTQISSEQTAAILAGMPQSLQTDVAHRIATLEGVPQETISQVEEALVDELEDVLSGAQAVEGVRVAADILNRIGSSLEKHVLHNLDAVDPEVAEEIRNRMFTFDDLARLDPGDIRTLVQAVDPNELLVALKAAGKGVLDAILSTMSERRQQRMLEDMGDMPRMRLSEVEQAQLRIVQQMRQLEDQGAITLARDQDTFV